MFSLFLADPRSFSLTLTVPGPPEALDGFSDRRLTAPFARELWQRSTLLTFPASATITLSFLCFSLPTLNTVIAALPWLPEPAWFEPATWQR